jgi:nucleoid-associated protein YgaU
MAQGLIGTVGINLAAAAGATDAQAFLKIPAPPPQMLGGNSGKTVITSGGNLFAIAAAELGDATQWYRIAQASGLDDPMLSGVVTLTIPDAIQAPSAGIPASGVTIL